MNETIRASEFKAKCLEVLDKIKSGALERVVMRPPSVVAPWACLRRLNPALRRYPAWGG